MMTARIAVATAPRSATSSSEVRALNGCRITRLFWLPDNATERIVFYGTGCHPHNGGEDIPGECANGSDPRSCSGWRLRPSALTRSLAMMPQGAERVLLRRA